MRRAKVIGPVFVLLLLGGLVLPTPAASAAASPKTVKVLLSEWLVQARPKTVSAGRVRFVVRNAGSEEHELMIMRADGSSMMSTKSDGSLDEDMMKGDIVGQIMGIDSKQTKSKTFRLEAGKYMLVCNLVDDMGDVHYAKGMHNTLRVT